MKKIKKKTVTITVFAISAIILIVFLLRESPKDRPNNSRPPTNRAKVVPSQEKQKVESKDSSSYLKGLNQKADYNPAPGDLSLEGFNFTHREFALILSGSVYLRQSRLGIQTLLHPEVLKQRTPALQNYIYSLQKIERSAFNKWGPEHKISFLINAYSSHYLKFLIERNFQVDKPKEALSQANALQLFGQNYSFHSFLSAELMPLSKDPRIYLNLPCFEQTCPDLRNQVYNYINLEELLNIGVHQFMMNKTKNNFEAEKKMATLSPSIKNYETLIKESGQTLMEFVAKYCRDEASQPLLRSKSMTLHFGPTGVLN